MKKGGSRKNKTKQAYSVIGLKTPSFKLKVAGGDSHNWYDMVADFTTYPDRAIIKLTHNDTGEPEIKILGGCIKGKTVSMLAGSSGYKWEFTDYASIERNGEKSVEISNDYITSSDQCKAVGDYEWKESRYHPEYVVELNGTHYEYAIGDRWTLQVDYTLNGNVLEHIDTDVIIESVSYGKSVGSLGSTKLGLRVPSSAWALTMAKNAKLTGAGKVNWKGNRSNIITVAASDYVGQADFYCDGIADDVEIEAAIAMLNESGGGEIRLTAGTFVDANFSLYSNITISGEGLSTILDGTISSDSKENCIIQNLVADNIDISACTNFLISGTKTKHLGLVGTGCKVLGSYVYFSDAVLFDYELIDLSGSDNVVSGCTMQNNSAVNDINGIYVDGDRNVINGNYIYGTTSGTTIGVNLTANSSNCIVTSCLIRGFDTTVVDSGTTNTKANNVTA